MAEDASRRIKRWYYTWDCQSVVIEWEGDKDETMHLGADPGFATGGIIQPAQDHEDDSVPLMLDNGYIVSHLGG